MRDPTNLLWSSLTSNVVLPVASVLAAKLPNSPTATPQPKIKSPFDFAPPARGAYDQRESSPDPKSFVPSDSQQHGHDDILGLILDDIIPVQRSRLLLMLMDLEVFAESQSSNPISGLDDTEDRDVNFTDATDFDLRRLNKCKHFCDERGRGSVSEVICQWTLTRWQPCILIIFIPYTYTGVSKPRMCLLCRATRRPRDMHTLYLRTSGSSIREFENRDGFCLWRYEL